MMLRLSVLLLLFTHSTHSELLGWVESPGYPRGYPRHSSLNWSRCAPKGHVLSIELIHLDLEDSHNCENDAVQVSSDGRLISVLCGKMKFEELQSVVNPALLSSPGGCLSLSFRSDYSNTRRHTGFKGFYTIKDFDECEDSRNTSCTQFCHNYIGGYRCSCRHGYHLAEDKHTCTVHCNQDLSGQKEGDVSSPSWPRPYAENAECRYTVSVDADLQVELHFSNDFDVEESPDGECIDAIRIETQSGTLGPFCGSTPPPSPFLTHSHDIRIVFTSNSFGTNGGFSLHFKTRDKVCAAVTPHSTMTPQKPHYDRGQMVTVKCDVGYITNTLNIHALSTQYETTCQSTGTWTPTYTCEPVNCGKPVIPKNGILQLLGPETPQTQYEDQVQFNCSSKYYKLEGDDTYICSASGEWVSVNGETKLPKCTPVCGMPDNMISSLGRIWGGQEAKLGEIPWQLLVKDSIRGGASLISDRWAVTAAHVVQAVTKPSLDFYGGLVNRSLASPGRALKTEKIIIHPNYTEGTSQDSRTNFDHDIALIKFSERVTLGPNLLPICLPEADMSVRENEVGTVSGWGYTEERTGAPVLRYADIGVYSLDTCKKTPKLGSKQAMVFTDNMFCAGGNGMDSCKGDSGGPFFFPSLSVGTGPYYLNGIVSWGPPCVRLQNKGYYTKVKNYVDWIKATIESTDKA